MSSKVLPTHHGAAWRQYAEDHLAELLLGATLAAAGFLLLWIRSRIGSSKGLSDELTRVQAIVTGERALGSRDGLAFYEYTARLRSSEPGAATDFITTLRTYAETAGPQQRMQVGDPLTVVRSASRSTYVDEIEVLSDTLAQTRRRLFLLGLFLLLVSFAPSALRALGAVSRRRAAPPLTVAAAPAVSTTAGVGGEAGSPPPAHTAAHPPAP